MAESFLSPKELAERWNLRYGTLARWRHDGTGPSFMKFGKCVRYRLEDVIEYEQRATRKSPATNAGLIAETATSSTVLLNTHYSDRRAATAGALWQSPSNDARQPKP